MTYIEFCLNIQKIFLAFDFRVTSWFRSPASNASVGGAARSWHLCGMAVDIVLETDEDKDTIIDMASALALEVVDEGNHLHIEPRS